MSRLIRTLRYTLSTAIWRVGDWLARRHRAVATVEQIRRQTFGPRVRALRMTERVREAFRGGWLRVRRDDDSRP